MGGWDIVSGSPGFWQGCRQQPGSKTSPRAEQLLKLSKTVRGWAKLPETSQADLKIPVGVRES